MTKTGSYLFIAAIAVPSVFVGFAVWFGILLLADHFGRPLDSSAVFNAMVISLCVLVLFPLLHRGLYRTFWNNDQRQRSGLPALQGTYLDGNQPLPPPVPHSVRTAPQTAAYVACYALGFASLLWLFLPLAHTAVLLHFVGKHSRGTASAGSLLGFLVGYLPMALLCVPFAFLLRNDQQAIARGGLPPAEELRLRLKICWLFSFAAAFAATTLFCQMFSSMIARYLRSA